MFYRDERYKEIIVIIPAEAVEHNYLTVLDLEVYSHIKYCDDIIGITARQLYKLINSNESSILKAIVSLNKSGLIDLKEYNNNMHCQLKGG